MASKGTCTSFLLVPVLTWQQGHQIFNQPKCELEINFQQYFRWDQTVIHVLNVCCVQIGQLFLFLSVCPWTHCFRKKQDWNWIMKDYSLLKSLLKIQVKEPVGVTWIVTKRVKLGSWWLWTSLCSDGAQEKIKTIHGTSRLACRLALFGKGATAPPK